MVKFFVFSVSCFFFLKVAYAQKREIYVNDKLEIISEEEFKEPEYLKIFPNHRNDFLTVRYDLDTVYLNIKTRRIVIDTLSKKQHLKIVDLLKKNLKILGKVSNL